MPYFHFSQNNSGGSFRYDKSKGITENVIIWAKDYDDANDKATDIGLYFDGVSEGIDCPCCGNRWYKNYDKGDKVPSIGGIPISKIQKDKILNIFGYKIAVHPKDKPFYFVNIDKKVKRKVKNV